jgi:hypothetical protein
MESEATMTTNYIDTNIRVADTVKIPAELLDVLAAMDDDLPMLPPLQTIARYNKSTDTAKLPTELLDALDDTYIPLLVVITPPDSPLLDDELAFDDTDTARFIPIRE